MIVELVALVIFCINALPPPSCVGGNLIPRQIVTSLKIDYAKHCRLQFSEYVKVHKAHNNTMQEQTTSAIALRPTGKSQEAYFFMSLTIDQRLNCQSFATLPLPHEVINCVHCLARQNPKVLDIRDRYLCPFLKPEGGKITMKTIPPTLCQTTTVSSISMRVKTIRKFTTTSALPLT